MFLDDFSEVDLGGKRKEYSLIEQTLHVHTTTNKKTLCSLPSYKVDPVDYSFYNLLLCHDHRTHEQMLHLET